MPTSYTAVFSKTKTGAETITLTTAGLGMIIPGFRIYQGKIQAPAKKFCANWYPAVYFSPDEAEKIYRAVVEAAPDGTYILPVEKAIGGLVHNPAVLEWLG